MSKHRKVKIEYESPACCGQGMYGMGGYGMGGYGGGYGASYGGGGGAWGIRWIYALLILIVIVLQFGRRDFFNFKTPTGCCGDGEVAVAAVGGVGGYGFPTSLIDNSVLFIIVVFLLILCAGCWFGGGFGGYGGGCGGFY